MSATQLLAHFDRLAEAPDAVPRLRRFILDLAVRGKLVEQDAGDEPAAELIKRIQVERTKLVKAGEFREEKASAKILGELPANKLPVNWSWVPFGVTVNTHIGGGTPSKSNATYWNGGILWASVKDVGKTKYLDNTIDRITEEGLAASSSNLIQPGNLIVVTRMGLGKVSINRVPVAINQDLRALSLSRLMSIDYCYIFLKTHGFEGSGLTVKGIKIEELLGIAFPLPPLAEQHRIVAKVDELMTLCDQLEAAQQERERRRDRLAAASLHRLNQPTGDATPEAQREHASFLLQHLPHLTTRSEHIKSMRQAILNLAVQGRLVPQVKSEESASELLANIQIEKVRLVKSGVLKKICATRPIPEEELLFSMPEGWKLVRIGDLLLGESQNGYSKRPDDAIDGIPILRISAGTVRRDGVVAEEQFKLVGGISAAQRKQYEVAVGDLLACRFNGNRRFVGRISLYTGYLGNRPIYPDKLIRLRLMPGFVSPDLVRHFSESEPVRKDIEGYCATTVGNWGISAANMKEVKIPLPPLAEQHRIVAKVDELMALCDQLEAQLTTAQTDSRRLLEAVLEAALSTA